MKCFFRYKDVFWRKLSNYSKTAAPTVQRIFKRKYKFKRDYGISTPAIVPFCFRCEHIVPLEKRRIYTEICAICQNCSNTGIFEKFLFRFCLFFSFTHSAERKERLIRMIRRGIRDPPALSNLRVR